MFSGIRIGVVYRFRYRVQNAVGWSGYSPITFIAASTIPGRPPIPALGGTTTTTVTLNLSPSTDDGGSPILNYEIWTDGGGGLNTAPSYTNKLTGYDGTSASYTTPAGALTAGAVYRFVYAAVNANGKSAFSEPFVAGVGAPATLASAPVRVSSFYRFHVANNTIDMLISWAGIAITHDLPVLGYQLLVDDGLGGNFAVKFDSGNNPLATRAIVSGLLPSYTYRF